ncbi:DNA topology modulation protein FlaR [Octadecabacter sp. 1_MG-2023]|uniref:DNA topology modulation protein FlaR n=1 Tax=unclassified Octadecabacter TaxID=196158 RepID=UPI001C08F1BD|nr:MULTISPECIES: DNA topology modulation protein FlaR [unclassified Octadecabacter]MBU2991916.1 DNA topology modulation protein FlaR [Octadecabacter sp. B2R22]MDO6735890.1 DNA topology modulation protein FlaR [Octadecabacter sp. 1_MG-2023]
MKRIIITGANGSGKSHFAAQCHGARPDVPLMSFDAIKLTTNWIQRPRSEIDADLVNAIQGESWILEGGPSLLPLALSRADAVVWLDPPIALRAWRLLKRPLKRRGMTRPELPDGNPDYLMEQYRFAWRSLRKDTQFRASIAVALSGITIPLLTVYSRVDADSALSLWAGGHPD